MESLEKIDLTEEVKKIIIRSVYSNDDLFDQFVLKGGNAIALVHNKKIRKSIDVDFSIASDFPGGVDALGEKLKSSLEQGFNESLYHIIDFKIKETPKVITADLESFWGGYAADFKIIDFEKYKKLDLEFTAEVRDSEELSKLNKEELHKMFLDILRRNSLSVHGSTKIEIDISKHEAVSNKIEKEIDGVSVVAYSVEMIVAEKLRALCQQHIEYGYVVKRNRPGSPRPRDFFDIHLLMEEFNIDLLTEHNLMIIREIFDIKKVPLELLTKLEDQRTFHGSNFVNVTASLVVEASPQEDFDYYFEYVNKLANDVYNALG